jgi:hypothetical protein
MLLAMINKEWQIEQINFKKWLNNFGKKINKKKIDKLIIKQTITIIIIIK